MKIGILQCGHSHPDVIAKHGDFDQMFIALLSTSGFEFQTYNVVDMEFPDHVGAADGWLLTGSPHGAYETHAFIPPLTALIREIHTAKRPMVGICFGHQIIAQAMGGTVEKYEGGWAIGQQEYVFSDTFAHLGQVTLNAWHQDQVTRCPDGAKTIAQNAFCQHAGLIYGDEIFTLQAHPEIRNPILQEYIKARGGDPALPKDLMAHAKSLQECPTDDLLLAEEIAQFFKKTQGAT